MMVFVKRADEMKKALISVLAKNTELESEIERLNKDLKEETVKSAAVMSEVVDLRRRNVERCEKSEMKMTAVMR
jgi:regulator of replication initiation timing